MEQLFLTCLQAQLLIGRITASEVVSPAQKNDLVWEVKQVTKKGCFKDAND